MSERRPSVLIVAQFSPPAGFSAARRTHGLAKYLERLGHRVTVLTSLASGRGPVPDASRTVRTRDLVASRVNWRRESFEAAREGGGFYAEPSPVASLVVPDLSLIGWLPFSLARARALARTGAADCVLTTSPPESAHLVGMALSRTGTPWIADLRDGWTFESTHPDWPFTVQRRLDAALERAVVTRADLVTTVTDELTDDLRTRLGARAITLSNGFDPDERVEASKAEVGLDPDRHSVVHTGRMAFAGRSPAPVLDALALLRADRPELVGRLELVFAGPLSAPEREMIEAAGRHSAVRAVGTLSRAETLRLQRAADTLLLLTGRDRRSEATAKLYEYLAAGRPTLVLGEGSAAARVVRETGAGTVTSADDPSAIAGAVAAVGEGRAAGEAGDETVGRYAYPSIAARLSEQIERLAGVSRSPAHPTAEDNRVYWEERLGEGFGLEKVGYIGLGRAFNTWMYRARRSVLERRIGRLMRSRPGMRVLDVGSGTGFYVELWRDLGASPTGSDITEAAMGELRRRVPAGEFVRFDVGAEGHPFGERRFDLVSAFDVLFHIVDDVRYERAFANMASVLEPGGLLLFTDNFLHAEPIRTPTQASRTLAQTESAVRAAGLEVIDRRPAMYLMNGPVDSDSTALRRWWQWLSRLVGIGEAAGWLAGAALYPLEVELASRLRESPTTEMMLCRRLSR